jgi:acetyl esterase
MSIAFKPVHPAAFLLSALVGLTALAACDRPRTDRPSERTPNENSPASPNAPVAPAASPELRSGTMGPNERTGASGMEPKDPLAAADSDMKNVLAELESLGAKPIATLGIEQARKQPSPADAVTSLLKKENKKAAPIAMARVEERKFPGAGGPLGARIYTPTTDEKKPLPVTVYYHGGGFAIANLDTYDASARSLAKGAGTIVVSADYRHAPEQKFPAAHDDAFAAYDWTLKNAASFGGDPKRVAVAGESAGGNLAANVSIMARDKGVQLPVHQLLVYPIAQTGMETRSYKEWANAKPLDRASMGWFFDKYVRSPADRSDPRLSLVDANLKGLPPTTIVLAEIDPLRSDGDMLADKLEGAGVKVERKAYEGVTHEFFGLGAYVADAKDAEDYASGKLKAALKK